MSILINTQTRVLIQGITGKEGSRAARSMCAYGTDVAAGVTPGKGGLEVDGKPVFNSIKEALDVIPGITATMISVPPNAAKNAILEAIQHSIPLITILTERIPIQDTAFCLAAAREKNITIIGPSSLGVLSPGAGRIGIIGGEQVGEIFTPGSIGIISRSGGMTNELSWCVRQAGLGQSTVVHVGGDLLLGTSYADLLLLFEEDSDTRAVIVFGEHGGSYEFEIIPLIEEKKFTKPLAVYVGGKFASTLPEGLNIGHAGAIIARGSSAQEKESALRETGVMIAERPENLIGLVKNCLLETC